MSEINLKEDERRIIVDDGVEETYANTDVPPYRSVYIVMGYNTRSQLFRLFSNTLKTYTLKEVYDRIEGDPEDIEEDLLYMWNLDIIKSPTPGVLKGNGSSPIMNEIRDLFENVEREMSGEGSYIQTAYEV